MTYHYWHTAVDKHIFEANLYFVPPKDLRQRLSQEAHRAVDAGRDMPCNVSEQRRTMNHRRGDPVNPGWADFTGGVDQRVELVNDDTIAVKGDDGDLYDPIFRVQTGRFHKDDSDPVGATEQIC
jgi:hypothetical protein